MRLAAAARLLAQLESVKRDPRKNNVGEGHRRFLAVWPQPRVRKHYSWLPELRSEGHSVVPKDPQKDLLATNARSSHGLLLNQKSSSGGDLRYLKKKHGHKAEEKLKNAKLCDPTLDEADVGLLSCGYNYYCAESHDSYLGGICVDVVDHNALQQQQHRRRVEENADFSETVTYCDASSTYFSKCDCTMFDTVSGDGYIQCLLYENYCIAECPTICFDFNTGRQLTSNMTNSYTDCYNFLGSYEKELCYTSLENGCSISVDGTICNNCEPVTCNSSTLDIGKLFAWDCTNVPGGTQGSYCNNDDYLIPALDLANCTERNSTTPNWGWIEQIFAPARTTEQPPTFAPVPATTQQLPTFTPAPATTDQPSGLASAPATTEPPPIFAPAPATELPSVAVTAPGVTVIFSQVNRLTDNDVLLFEYTVERWFDAYYNSRRRHRLLLQRILQQANSPAGIQNMRSHVDVTNQTVSIVSNTVTFSQELVYDTSEMASLLLPEDLVLLPWKDIAYSNSLAEKLKQELPEAFGDLGTPITTPAIFAPIDVVDDADGGSNKSLYLLSLLVLIPIAAVIGYIFHRRRSTHGRPRLAHAVGEGHDLAESEPARHPRENETIRPQEPRISSDPSAELSSVHAVAQKVETTEHLPEYKDQCRLVQSDVPNTPLAAAVLMDRSKDK